MTTADVIQIVLGVGIPLIGLLLWATKRYLGGLHREVRRSQDEAREARERQQEIQIKLAGFRAEIARLESKSQDAAQELVTVKAQLSQTAISLDGVRAECAKATAERNSLQSQLTHLTADRAKILQQATNFKQERDHLRLNVSELKLDLGRREELAKHFDGSRGEVASQLDESTRECRRLSDQIEILKRQLAEQIDAEAKSKAEHEGRVAALELVATREAERAAEAIAASDKLQQQVESAISQEERLWERPAPPETRPLAERRFKVISVLNLKGGVGKTTLTANLAGQLAQNGKKVLVIDADYQRNLSMLLMSDRERVMLHKAKMTLQHFLTSSGIPEQLIAAISPVPQVQRCSILTNSDDIHSPETGLEHVEMRLMAEWMLRPESRDVRMLLRDALNTERFAAQNFDYVLVDCPPRFTTACVNAVVASDFILVPTLLDGTSMRSVTNLLRLLKAFKERTGLNHIKLLGVVANRVGYNRETLVQHHQAVWDDVTGLAEVWGEPVHRFEAMIKDDSRFARAAGGTFEADHSKRTLARADHNIAVMFLNLINEIETRIAHESQRTATVPA